MRVGSCLVWSNALLQLWYGRGRMCRHTSSRCQLPLVSVAVPGVRMPERLRTADFVPVERV